MEKKDNITFPEFFNGINNLSIYLGNVIQLEISDIFIFELQTHGMIFVVVPTVVVAFYIVYPNVLCSRVKHK